MSLEPGSRIGHFEVVARIGQGGMGEVYRARDTALGRDVALKVLPDTFAHGSGDAASDRLMRFEREAKVLASLNHPNIAQIHGLERSGPVPALVMELVEGPTLEEVISRDAPLGLPAALLIMDQLVSALDAAHERGIVHRDLKPANIKVTDDGTVKVLDFGLAKAVDAAGGAEDLGARPDDSSASTMTSPAMTAIGMVMGTAAYMSPEQARGRPVDKRADIWAFGGLSYEMLTGRRPFGGEEIADLLVAVLSKEPDWTAVPAGVPAPIVSLLRRCLDKDPKRRLRDIGDARDALERARETGEPGHAEGPVRTGWSMPWIVAAAAVGLVVGMAVSPMWTGGTAPRTTRAGTKVIADISIDPAAPLALGTQAAAIGYDSRVLTLSPDGQRLVYLAGTNPGTSLRIRDLATGEERPLAGTEGAVTAAFSPDGEALAFLANDRVKRLDLSGGTPIVLCEARASVLVFWPDPDTIYFTEDETWTLSRVAARSPGPSRPAVSGEAPRMVSYSDVLAGGRLALAVDRESGIGGDYADAVVVDLETGRLTPLPLSGYGARYVQPGYLVFGRSASLLAVPFDVTTLKTTGPERIVASGVAMNSFFFQVHASVSATGLLAYAPGGDMAVGRLAWVDRRGVVTYLPEAPALFGALSLSPDGRRIAVHVGDVQDYIYVREGDRGYRVAADRFLGWPGWSPDSQELVAQTGATRTEPAVFYIFPLEQPAFDAGISLPGLSLGGPSDWSPAEDVLAVMTFDTEWRSSFMRVGESATTGTFQGAFPAFSPDGRFVAYTSTRGTNSLEIYIRSYPDGTASVPFSVDGGVEPVWNRTTGELFYRNGAKWYAAKVATQPELAWEPVHLVFDTEFLDTPGKSYAVSPDGQRLLVVKRAEATIQDRVRVVTNWLAETDASR